MAALFSTSQSAVGGSGSSGNNLVEFRAGKMNMREKMVHPDTRKGMVYVHQSDDMLMHFCWKDRTSGSVEDDLILFPDDTEFIPVPQCKTGRVFLLKFKNSSRKLFFWMQEPKSDKDEELCKKVNNTLNNPPTPGSAGGAGGLGGGTGNSQLAALNQAMRMGNASDADMSAALGGMDQAQMMQFLNLVNGEGAAGLLDGSQMMFPGLGGGSASTANSSSAPPPPSSGTAGSQPTANPPSATSPPIALSDLQNILSGINVPTGGAGAGAAGGRASAGPMIDLESVLSNDRVRQAVEGAEGGHRDSLLPHLPIQTSQELASSLRSPQFRQAASTFGMALQTGELTPVLRQMSLPSQAITAASKGDVEGFARSLEDGGSGEGGSGSDPTATGGNASASGSSAGGKPATDDGKKKDDNNKKDKDGNKQEDNMDLD